MTRRAAVEAPATHEWVDYAACRAATPAEADALVEVSTLAEAAPLIERWCAGCPVALLCEAQGRALRAGGLWGGALLREGRAPRQAATPRPRRPAPPRTTPEQRQTIRMRVAEGASIKSTAARHGLAPSTVRAIVARGVAQTEPDDRPSAQTLPDAEGR